MLNFFKCEMGTVKRRIKKPFIIATLVMVVIIGVVISQGNLRQLLKNELFQTLTLYFVIGGIWYGKHIIAVLGKAPIDENTGEEYYPNGFSGSMFRWMIAIALGATVGAVMFFYDAVRVITNGIKGIVEKQQHADK